MAQYLGQYAALYDFSYGCYKGLVEQIMGWDKDRSARKVK